MIEKKEFVAAIYIKNKKAVNSFKDLSVLNENPVDLALSYQESDIDSLLVFDLSDQIKDKEDFHEILREICKTVNIPVFAGGNINSIADVQSVMENGASKVVLNFAKQVSQEMIEAVSLEYGKVSVAVTIASEDNLVINKPLLEMYADTLILIDELALKNCLGASTLPCIVYLPEISLDKMLMIMEKPNVCGISGNIVNENRKEISALKTICKENGIPVKCFEPLIPFSELKKGPDGLVCVVVQDYMTNEVLMVAYMNEEAYLTTLKTKKMTYYSRSRNELWIKGLTSGHFQYVKQLSIDCDNDTLLAKVKQIGAACHTGSYSCFYRDLIPMKQEMKAVIRDENQKKADLIEKALQTLTDSNNEIQNIMNQIKNM